MHWPKPHVIWGSGNLNQRSHRLSLPRRDTTYQRGQRPGYARGEPGPSAQRCLYRLCRGGRLPTRQPSRAKLKKGQNDLSQIQLVQNPDVIATIAQSEKRPKRVIGFAAETQDALAYGQKAG